jgi:hypothetical protein
LERVELVLQFIHQRHHREDLHLLDHHFQQLVVVMVVDIHQRKTVVLADLVVVVDI